MSKYMTRKGLAFGAGLALIGSGLVASPAQAAGVTGFIPVAPTSGPEAALAITSGTGQTFSLTAEPTGSVVNANIKWLITDSDGAVVPTATSDGATAVTVADNDSATANATTDVVTFPWTKANGTYYGYFTSNLHLDNGAGAGDVDVITSLYTFKTITVSSNVASVKADIDITSAQVTALGTAEVDGASAFVQVSDLRAADNSYVLDSGLNTPGDAPVLELRANDANDRTITVQAWVDLFNDDEIGASEYVSDPVEISFVDAADFSWTTVLDAPKVGDDELSATATVSPLLNLAEDGNSNMVRIAFTRQDSTSLVISGSASQDALTGEFTASVATVTGGTSLSTLNATTGAVTGSTAWASLTTAPAGTNVVEADSSVVDEVATFKFASHGLRVGDKVTVSGATDTDLNTEWEVASVPSADVFTFAATDVADDAAPLAGTVTYTVTTYASNKSLVDRVFPGTYSAQVAIEDGATSTWFLKGAASALGTLAVAADDVALSTVGSSSVQGSYVTSDDSNVDVYVKTGTASATVTATVLDEDGDPVGAGRAVVSTLSSRSSSVKVNGKTVGQTLTTDANGQVTFEVTSSTALAGQKVKISVVAEGVASSVSSTILEWAAPALSMYDLNVSDSAALATGSRFVSAGSSYDLALFVADQWYSPAADADYRVAVSGSGVTEGFAPLSSGKATIKVTDAQVSTAFDTVLTLQKKGTSGVFANTTTSVTLTTNTTTKGKVTLGADATSLYVSATTVDLSDAVAKVALVERDTRVAFAAQPAYANDVVVTGKVTNSGTAAAQAYSVVTVSGPTSILFSNGAVDKRGSITLVADSNGEFAVKLYSTTAQTDTVITVTANGVSATTKVTFTGIGVGEGTSLVVTAPAAVKPASTFQVKAKLADTYGNGVDTAAGRVKVTYTGPGIIFGTLPTETDANGELSFSVLLGSNDTGNVVVKVSYDQNGDADYVDAKDLNTTATIAITASGTVASADTKVNAGSFKGYVAVYAKGYEGKRLSAKVGKDWVVVPALASNFVRVVEYTGAGYTINVPIYIDRVLVDTITVVTK